MSPTIGRKLLWGSVALCIGFVLAVTIVLWVRRSDPVLFAFSAVLDPHGEQLLNPFRVRAPEQTAERLLGELEGGECAGALRAIDASEDRVAEVCTKEREYRLIKWKLVARQDDGARSSLRYDVERRDVKRSFHDPLWITVRATGET